MKDVNKMQREVAENFPYEDIVNLPHFKSPGRAEMPLLKRAAQFMPFKSLNEYDGYVSRKADELNAGVDENYEIIYE